MALLTTKQAAKLLSVHPKQLYRLLKNGLPAAPVGAGWRFESEAVLNWARALHSSLERRSSNVRPAAAPLRAANGDLGELKSS